MGGSTSARDVLHTFVAQRLHIDTVQQMLPSTEQDGCDRQVKFVNECRAQTTLVGKTRDEYSELWEPKW